MAFLGRCLDLGRQTPGGAALHGLVEPEVAEARRCGEWGSGHDEGCVGLSIGGLNVVGGLLLSSNVRMMDR